jgi:hypothetical protein
LVVSSTNTAVISGITDSMQGIFTVTRGRTPEARLVGAGATAAVFEARVAGDKLGSHVFQGPTKYV